MKGETMKVILAVVCILALVLIAFYSKELTAPTAFEKQISEQFKQFKKKMEE